MRLILAALACALACACNDPEPADDDCSFANGDPGTWETFAEGFFEDYCVECHEDGTGRRADFHDLEAVRADAEDIRCGVIPAGCPAPDCSGFPQAGQFPIGDGPRPADEERLRIVAWIEAGAP